MSNANQVFRARRAAFRKQHQEQLEAERKAQATAETLPAPPAESTPDGASAENDNPSERDV